MNLGRLSPEEVDSYAKVLKYLKPIPRIGRWKAKQIVEMQFAEVVNLRKDFSSTEGEFRAMSLFYGVPMWFLMRRRLIEYMHARNYLEAEIKKIDARERKHLFQVPDTDLMAAGIERLDMFGPLNTLDRLAKEFGQPIHEVEQWSYGLIFSLQYKRAVEADIDERLRAMKK